MVNDRDLELSLSKLLSRYKINTSFENGKIKYNDIVINLPVSNSTSFKNTISKR